MIFDKISEKRNLTYQELNNYTWSSSGTTVEEENLLKEATYFKCIKYNAEAVAKCPILMIKEKDNYIEILKQHKYLEKLTLRANLFNNITEVMKSLISIGEHEGISALYIDKSGLYPCKINQIIIDDSGILNSPKNNPLAYQLEYGGKMFAAFDKECIVYRAGLSWDGIHVNAVKDYLKQSIKTTVEGQEYLSNLFNNGMCSKVLVQMTSMLKDEKDIKTTQAYFNKLYSNNGKIFTVPAGYNISSLNMSLADSQFREIRSMSRKEIANLFGLTSSMINEDTSNQNDLEKDTLRYIQDTLQIKLKTLEEEFTWKLLTVTERDRGIRIKFDLTALIKSNPKTQQDILCNYMSKGAISINEVRRELGRPPIEGGDTLLFPSGQVTLDAIKNGDTSYLNKNNGGDKDNG